MWSIALKMARLAPVAVTAFLAGCVALTSELRDEGVVYYLPKSILTVTIREYHDELAGRKWYQIGGEGKSRNADGTENKTISPAVITEESVPDPAYRYTIKYRPSALSDDRLCITRKPDGLLNDVVFASDDRTPEIAFNVARFVAGAMPKPTGVTFSEALSDTSIKVRGYTSKVDPFDPESVFIFNRALERQFGARAGLKLDFHRMQHQIKDSQKTWPEDCKLRGGDCPARHWVTRCAPDQICYRTKLRLPVDLLQNGKPIDVNYANMVNVWDVGAVSVKRAMLVHKITKLRFQEGALVAAIIRKPSEVEEVSLLPLHVVNAALSVPSGLWANAFGSATSNAAVLEEMAKLTTQVNSLATAQNNLRNSIAQGTGTEGLLDDATSKGAFNIDCLDGSKKSISLNILAQ